ncbi:hypothetical protein [Simkania sp.]|uniref:hypothetical protein n=1 Tax=Simkania sp. TaxID=34094 RepID=UPI003B528D10
MAATTEISKEVPSYLFPLLEHGPERYLRKNMNRSLGTPFPELTADQKLSFVLHKLQHLFNHIITQTETRDAYAFKIQPDIHDCNPYLIDYLGLFLEIVSPWTVTRGLQMRFREALGLGAKSLQVLVTRATQTENPLEMQALL